ncbi:MAG: triose-phosphate isomerase [bacterium]
MKKIIVNFKDKFNNLEIATYIENNSHLDYSICVPNDYVNTGNIKAYSQDLFSIENLKENNYCGSILGHRDYKDDIDTVIKKINQLHKSDLEIIICLGEKEKKDNAYLDLINTIDLIYNSISSYNNIIIVYEPHWAIGGNNNIDTSYIINNITYIKNHICDKFNITSNLYYGGSVNLELISKIDSLDIVSGYLVSSFVLEGSNLEKLINLIN